MKYDDRPQVDAIYRRIATSFLTKLEFSEARSLVETLLKEGEDRSWASVWWAYDIVHHDLSDEGYASALDLLKRVDRSPECRATALMLRAEIELTWAIETDRVPDKNSQVALLSEAVELAPSWPTLRLRLAHALSSLGDVDAARESAQMAMALIQETPALPDRFDKTISGISADRESMQRDVDAVGCDA